MANALALRLKRLEAIREVADRLFARPQLDRDVFSRGQPEPIAHIKRPQWTATLYDLLSAYAAQRQKQALGHVRFAKRTVWSLAEARDVLERLIGQSTDWTRLDEYLIAYVVEPALRCDRVRLELCLDARTGARGSRRDSSAGSLRADLSAQARRRRGRRVPGRRGR